MSREMVERWKAVHASGATFDASCGQCGKRPGPSSVARKIWRTAGGAPWAYRCGCGHNNNLASRPGWEAAAKKIKTEQTSTP